LAALARDESDFPAIAVIAPATDKPDDHIWHVLGEIIGNIPGVVDYHKQHGRQTPPALPNYDTQAPVFQDIFVAGVEMMKAWGEDDAATVNKSAVALGQALPKVNPATYPSEAKRTVEVTYNRLAKLTIPGAALYFAAFVCFLMSAYSGVTSLRLWGLRLFVLGLLVHTAGIGIRWWLVGSIPIKNQFESVLFSAWFGAVVGLGLEMWRSRGIFGAAASFFGWLSLIAIFATPFVTGKQIGAEIGQVQGVLMSYWLYIHVTLVVASYALIGMGFLLGVWWLVKYYAAYRTLRRVPQRRLSADAADLDATVGGMDGGAASLGFARTLAMMLFMPRPRAERAVKLSSAPVALGYEDKTRSFLATLDQCNLVILQLAFWVLGVGIICGAIWADESWGRPWGWDPKETFALVTWIVYLIVVHVRFATADKAWWTSVLSIVGFFVMLFNWIGVNFFLVGLHSYA
ncbi:MAG: cytochrome c biogenesis protein CcsA, partial [Tepidisphaeraceae bacterium]